MAKVISMFSDYWLRREPVAERGRMSATRTVSDIEPSARAGVMPSGATRMRERELAVRPSEVVAGAAERGEVTGRECGAATSRREGASGTVGAAEREVVSRGRECGAAGCEAGASEVTERDIRAAKRCGVALDEWMRMTKKARKRAHLEYLAAKKGMSVEEMRADRDRRMAAKYGMPLECWRKMPLQARILYMWRVKSERRARARKDRVSNANTSEVN